MVELGGRQGREDGWLARRQEARCEVCVCVCKCLSIAKENIKAHHVMYHAIYFLCRLALFLVLDIYIYYIHPELRVGDYRFGLGKGARPL